MTCVSILLCIFSCLVVYIVDVGFYPSVLQYVSLFIILLKLLLSMKLMVFTIFNQTMYISSLVSLSLLPPHYVYLSFTVCFSFSFLNFSFPPPSLSLSLSLYSNDSSILVPGTEPVKVIKPSGCGMIR